jgi:hypothetical protein
MGSAAQIDIHQLNQSHPARIITLIMRLNLSYLCPRFLRLHMFRSGCCLFTPTFEFHLLCLL